MKTCTFNAAKIFTATKVTPLEGAPKWMNLEFSAVPDYDKELVKGCGLYCVAYGGRAIYVGKFMGTAKNPSAGNVLKTRWLRHIATLTLRGKRGSFSKGVFDDLIEDLPAGELLQGLEEADRATLCRDRGFLVSSNRALFVRDHWNELQREPRRFLSEFDFGYVSLPSEVVSRLDVAQARKIVSNAEVRARGDLGLCCNGESNYKQANKQKAITSARAIQHFVQLLHEEMPTKIRAGLTLPKSSARPINTKSEGSITVPNKKNKIDPASAMEFLEDEFPEGWPTDLLQKLRTSLASDAVEVHATASNLRTSLGGCDLRVRVLDVRRPRNVFTIAWQPRLSRCNCRILLKPAQIIQCPGVSEVKTKSADPLKTGFAFDASINSKEAIEGLLKLIKKAIEELRGGTGD